MTVEQEELTGFHGGKGKTGKDSEEEAELGLVESKGRQWGRKTRG